MRQTQRSPEGPRHLHRIPRLSEAPREVPYDRFLRISVGIENADDLIEDLRAALEKKTEEEPA